MGQLEEGTHGDTEARAKCQGMLPGFPIRTNGSTAPPPSSNQKPGVVLAPPSPSPRSDPLSPKEFLNPFPLHK